MIELRWLKRKVKKSVPRTAPGGSVLIGGKSREVTTAELVLQYRLEDYLNWKDIPTVIEEPTSEEPVQRRRKPT